MGIPDSLRDGLAKQKRALLGKRARKLGVSEDEAAMALKEKAGHVKEALQASLQEARAKIKKRACESAKSVAEEPREQKKKRQKKSRRRMRALDETAPSPVMSEERPSGEQLP